ncbi:MAG: type VI secretion system baseplate subunit TssG [Pseudomonadota bacterium]|uniref:Type VI secretion system baseplate subunit TssG n=1 Tax=Caldimonas aquatica TaxID=376175 RepID=A0ABY6MSA0_9BURK|nr:type VI secretion system baseplate subunit TssG [Schlegelella aquatica]UZD54869.1 type VI secretion system baseplate subunit TssG [Schlegelella aquatica]
MPPSQRRDLVDVTARLLEQPHRFGLFQALRVIEHWHRRAGGRPRTQVLATAVRFRNSLSLAFPASEIEALRPVRAASSHGPDPALLELTPACFGLLGVAGALPHFYTELFAQRESHHKDTAARAFLDVFQQRAVMLFYEAWRKHRLALQYEDDRKRHFLPHVLALAGLGQDAVRQRLRESAGRLSDESAAFFSGAMQQRARSAAQIQRVLSAYFGVPVRIEQFVGRWSVLPQEAQTCLGRAGVLGETALVGARVWQRDLRVRLHIGPLGREEFDAFLPQGRHAAALRDWLPLLAGACVECEVHLTLAPGHAPEPRLAGGQAGVRLGWDAWLRTRASHHPLNDARYELQAAG